jgi:hypothetical protein
MEECEASVDGVGAGLVEVPVRGQGSSGRCEQRQQGAAADYRP